MGETVCVCTPDEGFPSFFGQMRLCWCLAWLPLRTLSAFSTKRTRSSDKNPCHLIELHSAPLLPIHYAGLVAVVFVWKSRLFYSFPSACIRHRALLTSPRPHRHILCRSLVLSVPIYIALYCQFFAHVVRPLHAQALQFHKMAFSSAKNELWLVHWTHATAAPAQRPRLPSLIKYEKRARSRSLRERSCWQRK